MRLAPGREWPVSICATTALSLDGLFSVVSTLAPRSRILACDLSLGGWLPHQAARELLAQLSIPWQAPQAHAVMPARTFCYGETIGRGVDQEASGVRSVHEALSLAELVANVLATAKPSVVAVVSPRTGKSWDEQNAMFVSFLASALRWSEHHVLLIADSRDDRGLPVGLQPRWIDAPLDAPQPAPVRGQPLELAALIPGIVASEVAARLAFEPEPSQALFLENGACLLAPALRIAADDASALAFDSFAAVFQDVPWLRAYAGMHRHADFVDGAFLRDYAFRCFAEGANDLGCALLYRVATYSQDRMIRESSMMPLYGMCIASQRFDTIAESPDPTPSSSPQYIQFLLQARGWARVMSGNAERGRLDLERAAGIPVRPCCGIEDLYSKNIYALALARTGDGTEALRTEQVAWEENQNREKPEPRFAYISAVNIARLHRAAGRSYYADIWYRRAFETSDGGRSSSDAIYDNACLARTAGEEERLYEALIAWMRAGLHFAACSAPEALAPRHCAMLIGRRPSPSDVPENMAVALTDALLKAAALYGTPLPESADGEPAPAFVSRDQAFPGRGWSVVGAQGWSVAVAPLALRPAVDGPALRRLRALLHRLLGLMGGERIDEAAATYIVDDRFGREVAGTELEQLSVALRLGAERCSFGGNRRIIDAGARSTLESRAFAVLGPLVEGVNGNSTGLEVRFKRFRSPLSLNQNGAQIVLAAREGLSFAGLDSEERERIRVLERARVLSVELSTDAKGLR
jgi:hypothetical protein